jgi:hypothetical protein
LSIGFRKLKGKIPLANSDPFAIAAAYHPPEEDKDTAVKVMMRGEIDTWSDSDIGHRSRTSMDVTAPVEGKLYAGYRRQAWELVTASMRSLSYVQVANQNDWIRQLYRESRGGELLGTVNPAVLENLFRQQAKQWCSISESYLLVIDTIVTEFNEKALETIFLEEDVR